MTLAVMIQPIPAFDARGVNNEERAARRVPDAKTHFPPNFSANIPPRNCVAILP
jgi:hypothetical protein